LEQRPGRDPAAQ